MSPTETLRAAATKLRETASKATPGPRKVGRIAGIGQCVSAPDLKFCVAVESGWVSKGDAAWIALMSPAVAEPLAAVLEEAAELYEWSLERCHADLRDQLEPRVRAQVEHELDLARSILGRTS